MVHSNSPTSSLKAQAKASLPSTPVLESTTKKWGVRAVAILAIGVLYAFANSINVSLGFGVEFWLSSGELSGWGDGWERGKKSRAVEAGIIARILA